MHLKQIELKNFRCFDSLEVDLHPRLTVFVAENGGGKTSVLDAIAAGLSPLLRVLTSANQRLSGPGIKDTDFSILTGSNGAEFKASFSQIAIRATNDFVWDEWKPATHGAQPEHKFGQSQLSELSQILKSYADGPAKCLPVFAYYGTQRGLIEIPKRLREKLYKAQNYDYPTSGLYGALDAQSDFKEMLKWFDAEEGAELRSQKETDGYGRSQALDAVRHSISAVLGEEYYDPHFDGKHKFCVRSKGEPKKLQVSQLSQGYQSVLAMVMDFARRLALCNRHLGDGNYGANVWESALEYYRTWNELEEEDELPFVTLGPLLAPAIMLVDEIDLHLHPSWQQRILDDLTRAFPHTQFIVTTHSPQVLTTVKRENIRVLGRDADGKWQASLPEHSSFARESKDALAYVMGVDPLPVQTDAQRAFQEKLRTYEQFVRQGLKDSPEAQELRGQIDASGYEIPAANLELWNFLANRKHG